jgi:hypothetical protein
MLDYWCKRERIVLEIGLRATSPTFGATFSKESDETGESPKDSPNKTPVPAANPAPEEPEGDASPPFLRDFQYFYSAATWAPFAATEGFIIKTSNTRLAESTPKITNVSK